VAVRTLELYVQSELFFVGNKFNVTKYGANKDRRLFFLDLSRSSHCTHDMNKGNDLTHR